MFCAANKQLLQQLCNIAHILSGKFLSWNQNGISIWEIFIIFNTLGNFLQFKIDTTELMKRLKLTGTWPTVQKLTPNERNEISFQNLRQLKTKRFRTRNATGTFVKFKLSCLGILLKSQINTKHNTLDTFLAKPSTKCQNMFTKLFP